MVFSSQIFLFLFLPAALLGYFIFRRELQNLYLVLISLFFYAWAGPKLLVVLLGYIAFNYLFGLLLSIINEDRFRLRRLVVVIAVMTNLGFLGYYKYLNFLTGTINAIGLTNLPLQEIALPLGISFFTFSGISYILDINLGKIEAERNPIDFALYMSFFPKLIQGPISRFATLGSQIKRRDVTVDKFAAGIYRFVIGLSKKVIIADQLGPMVDQIFATPALSNSLPIAWLGAIGYTFQLYFDFAGYTDMAIGLGKMFGFEIEENFNYPYISTSIGEFWRRWHMTLSSWFRDYVFYPLEFKRRKVKSLRIETNTLIVFFLTGLWHGASWNFVFWGLLHGIAIAIESFTKSKKLELHLPVYVRWLITMLVLIIGWVLFRAPNLSYAWQYLSIMFGLAKSINTGISLAWYLNAKIAVLLVIATIACIPWKTVFHTFTSKYEGTNVQTVSQLFGFVILMLISIIYVITSSYSSFIYFKF